MVGDNPRSGLFDEESLAQSSLRPTLFAVVALVKVGLIWHIKKDKVRVEMGVIRTRSVVE